VKFFLENKEAVISLLACDSERKSAFFFSPAGPYKIFVWQEVGVMQSQIGKGGGVSRPIVLTLCLKQSFSRVFPTFFVMWLQ